MKRIHCAECAFFDAYPNRSQPDYRAGYCHIRSVPSDDFPIRGPYDWCAEGEPVEQPQPTGEAVFINARRLGGPPLKVPVDGDGVGWDPAGSRGEGS